jgi:adenylate kinase family enzyme
MLTPADLSRTVILGNGGSGKSWLAERLAEVLAARAVDLDIIHWLPGGFNARRDPDEARAAVRALAGEDRWVIEGVYGWLAREALPRATALVLLDIPDDACVENVRGRGLRRGGDETAHLALIAWVREYRTRQNANGFKAHMDLFDAFPGPRARLRSRGDLAAQVAAARGGQDAG